MMHYLLCLKPYGALAPYTEIVGYGSIPIALLSAVVNKILNKRMTKTLPRGADCGA